MPNSCKCLLDHLLYKSAITVSQYDKILRNLKGFDWIPVTERLPEKRDWYLATFREKDSKYQWLPRVADYLPQKNEWRFIDGDREVVEGCLLECVAWMPLPKPYEEGAE